MCQQPHAYQHALACSHTHDVSATTCIPACPCLFPHNRCVSKHMHTIVPLPVPTHPCVSRHMHTIAPLPVPTHPCVSRHMHTIAPLPVPTRLISQQAHAYHHALACSHTRDVSASTCILSCPCLFPHTRCISKHMRIIVPLPVPTQPMSQQAHAYHRALACFHTSNVSASTCVPSCPCLFPQTHDVPASTCILSCPCLFPHTRCVIQHMHTIVRSLFPHTQCVSRHMHIMVSARILHTNAMNHSGDCRWRIPGKRQSPRGS